MQTPRAGRAAAALAAVTLGAGLLTACSGGDATLTAPTTNASVPAAADPTSSASPTASTSSSTAASPTSKASASTSHSPSAPAPTSSRGTKGNAGQTRVRPKDHAFSLLAPKGWVNVLDTFADTPFMQVAVRAPALSDGFYPNLNVTRQDQPYTGTAAAAADQSAQEFQGKGAELERTPERQLDGEPAAGYEMKRTVGGTKVVQVQYFVVHDGRLNVITGSAAPADRAGITEVVDQALASWAWGATG